MNEAIQQLYTDPRLDDCLEKMVPAHDRADFKQELFIDLMSRPPATIDRLASQGTLIFYAIKVVCRQSRQRRWFIHDSHHSGLPEDIPTDNTDLDARIKSEQFEERVLQEIRELDNHYKSPFFRLFLEAHAKLGSIAAIQRETGISRDVLFKAMKQMRQHFAKLR